MCTRVLVAFGDPDIDALGQDQRRDVFPIFSRAGHVHLLGGDDGDTKFHLFLTMLHCQE